MNGVTAVPTIGSRDRPQEPFGARARTKRGVLPNGELEQEWLVELRQALSRSAGVRYRGLAAALRDAIASGELPVGVKLPPERDLAACLSIARTTVVSAFNLLQAESLIVTKQGAGTWVVRRP